MSCSGLVYVTARYSRVHNSKLHFSAPVEVVKNASAQIIMITFNSYRVQADTNWFIVADKAIWRLFLVNNILFFYKNVIGKLRLRPLRLIKNTSQGERTFLFC